uniref:Uncharacterized protein n=1 Tax=Apteryx owenii TaxID=8824 RepID=A0A8B9S334_APTOW
SIDEYTHQSVSHSLVTFSMTLMIPLGWSQSVVSVVQIDDKEFDIPQVDTPPTLESILNETDDEEESFVLEDPFLLNIDNTDTHSYDTSSVASSDSGDRTHLKRKKKLPDSLSIHGSVIRLSLLKGISAQIASAADKVDAGLPTAIVSIQIIFKYHIVSLHISMFKLV